MILKTSVLLIPKYRLRCLEKLLAAGADAAPTSKTGHWKGLTALQLAQQNRNPGQREVMEKLFAEAAQRRAADQ